MTRAEAAKTRTKHLEERQIRVVWGVYRRGFEQLAQEIPERHRRVPYWKFRAAVLGAGVLKRRKPSVRRLTALFDALSRRPNPIPMRCQYCGRRHWTDAGFRRCRRTLIARMDAEFEQRLAQGAPG